jgi:hypothetical protein
LGDYQNEAFEATMKLSRRHFERGSNGDGGRQTQKNFLYWDTPIKLYFILFYFICIFYYYYYYYF